VVERKSMLVGDGDLTTFGVDSEDDEDEAGQEEGETNNTSNGLRFEEEDVFEEMVFSPDEEGKENVGGMSLSMQRMQSVKDNISMC